MHTHPVTFVLTADLGPEPLIPESATDGVTLDLDKLPKAVVSDNTLIDFSAARESVRGSLSLATAFAGRAAMAAMRDGDNEDDWFAAYKSRSYSARLYRIAERFHHLAIPKTGHCHS